MLVYCAMEALLAGTMPRLALSLLEFAVGLAGRALVSEGMRPVIRPGLHAVRDGLVRRTEKLEVAL
jgi:hypothetical protein